MKKTIWKIFTLLLLFSFIATPAFAQERFPEADRQDLQGARTVPSLAVSESGLYIVQLADPSLARYQGGIPNLAATSPEVTGVSKLDTAAPASVAYLDYLGGKQGQFISQMNTALGRSVSVEFQYKNVLNALAVAVSHEEALALAQLPGVAAVYPDLAREIETDVGPALIGAPTFWEGDYGFDEHRGEGVIIGFLDTGVNPVHPSFAEVDGDGYTHENPYGSGNYVGVCDSTEPDYDPTFPCNDKLIGAWNFYTGPDPQPASARDWNNHGSHVGGTIAGNKHDATFTVGLDMFTRTISGVAPRANVISYLVCFPSCWSTGSVAAVDQAIDDGVDVLNYSISGGDDPWDDAVDLAFLDAFAAGMFVSASAGNAGPGASTVAKTGPWNASVAASTHDRVIANTVDVTSPIPPAELVGMAAVPGSGPPIIADIEGEVIWAGTVAPSNVTGCDPFPAGAFTGEIALIVRGGCTFETKVVNATNAGAIAVIVYNSVGGPPITMGGLEPTTIPAVMLDKIDGDALAALAATETVEAVINVATSLVTRDAWADVMAGFSSRGPSQWDLLKPDYTAPGVNILAAGWQGEDAYVFLQGTSMSSPHGAGAAALMVQRYPDWSPAEIKSALAMTAWQEMLNDDGINPASYFAMGSGRVDLNEGALIGLVMDETADSFEAADPYIGGEPKTLNMPSMVDQNCIESCSWTRTVRSVLAGPADYQVIADAPVGMEITVVPDAFTIFPGATQTLTITVDVDLDVLEAGTWAFAQIELALAGNATTANGVLLQEGFEGEDFPPAGWTRYNFDGQTQQWARTTSQAYSGVASAWHTYNFTVDQDGWLVTPSIDIEPNTFLSFADRGGFMTWYGYSGVWLSTGSCDPDDGEFVELLEIDDSANNAWRQVPPINLSAYAGESACLAFVYGGLDAHNWFIDDVLVEVVEVADAVATHKLPIAVVPYPESAEITLDPDEFFSSQAPNEVVTETLTIGNTGGVDLVWEVVEEAPEATQPLLPVTSVTKVSTETAQEVTIGDDMLMFSALLGEQERYSPPLMPMAPGEMTITHSVAQTIMAGNSVACSPDNGVTTSDNGYLRTFTLSDFGIFGGFDVTKVSFGIENLSGAGGTLDVNLYTLDAEPFTYANMTLIGTAEKTLETQSLTIIEVPLTAAVPASATLVVEIDWPNTSGVSGFFVGSNNMGQTAPSYLRSVACGIPQPTNIAAIGFPGMHIIMNVTGVAEPPTCDAPFDVDWVDVSPLDGVVSPMTTQDVDITLDSTGIAPGEYSANLCIASNDPTRPLSVVPIEMEVFVAPIIEVDPEALESSQVADAQVTLPLDILNVGFDDLDWTIEEAPGMDSIITGVGFEEGFDDVTLLPGLGWVLNNMSAPLGASDWFQGNPGVFPSHSGAPNAYIGANFNNTSGVGTISNWLLTPEITMNNGDVFSFYTRRTGSPWEDRLQVRLSTSGDSTDVGDTATSVGDFDTLLLDINPTYAPGGYPSVWTQYEITISGLTGPTSGRLAFRYFVENGGPSGSNSDYIGIDTVQYAPGLPCDNPQDVPWLSVLPTSGQVAPGEFDTVGVTIDSTGLEVGSTHEAFLCVFSNDIANPVVPVPVTLNVVESAFVQVAHLAPFAEDASVTITLNGEPALTDFGYGDSTEYIELPVGEYDIAVIPTGAMDPAIEATVELEADTYYTVLAVGDGVNQDLALIALVDDLTAPAEGKFHLRLGHLAPFAAGPATADVRLKDGTPVLEDVDFGDITGFIPLDAGEYDLVITTPGGGTVLIDPEPVTFVEGMIISAFATGEGVNQDLGVFALPAGVEGFFLPLVVEEPIEEFAYVQVAHLAPFAEDAGVTITLNGEPALTDFGYGDSTEYIELLVGEYDIAVIPTGAMDPAIELTVELEADTYYTVLAVGDGVNQDLELIALVDDLTPPAEGKFHLRLGHLAPFAAGPATADVRLKDGTPVLLNVDFGAVTAFIPLDAGVYDLVITTPGGGTVLIDPEPVTFIAGQIISAFATGEGVNQDLGVFALPAGVEGFFLPLVVEEPEPEAFQIFLPIIFR